MGIAQPLRWRRVIGPIGGGERNSVAAAAFMGGQLDGQVGLAGAGPAEEDDVLGFQEEVR
ncbi:MAG TPA: hypothetical protein VFZ63_14255 [Jiangellaceae bacterium]